MVHPTAGTLDQIRHTATYHRNDTEHVAHLVSDGLGHASGTLEHLSGVHIEHLTELLGHVAGRADDGVGTRDDASGYGGERVDDLLGDVGGEIDGSGNGCTSACSAWEIGC